MDSHSSFCKKIKVRTGCNENTVISEGPSTSGECVYVCVCVCVCFFRTLQSENHKITDAFVHTDHLLPLPSLPAPPQSQPQPTPLEPTPPFPSSSTLSTPTGPPSLPLLLAFPAHGTSINIIQKIGTNYSTFGILLLNDLTGEVLNGLRHDHPSNVEDITMAIFMRWLQGKSNTPVTWNSLVNVLRKSELHILADQINACHLD